MTRLFGAPVQLASSFFLTHLLPPLFFLADSQKTKRFPLLQRDDSVKSYLCVKNLYKTDLILHSKITVKP